MKIAVLSDIHGNAAALESVLKHAMEKQGCEKIFILGDVIGYCANPRETLSALAKYQPQITMILGNHEEILLNFEAMFSGRNSELGIDAKAEMFKKNYAEVSKRAILTNLLTYDELLPFAEEKDVSWYFELCRDKSSTISEKTRVEGWDIFLGHGTYLERTLHYCYSCSKGFIINSSVVEPLVQDQKHPQLAFLGHTHIPMILKVKTDWDDRKRLTWKYGDPIALEDGFYVINPGSVGFPRDGDPRASYLVLDATKQRKTVTFFRLEYDVDATVDAMIKKHYGMDGISLLKTARIPPTISFTEEELQEMKERVALPGE